MTRPVSNSYLREWSLGCWLWGNELLSSSKDYGNPPWNLVLKIKVERIPNPSWKLLGIFHSPLWRGQKLLLEKQQGWWNQRLPPKKGKKNEDPLETPNKCFNLKKALSYSSSGIYVAFWLDFCIGRSFFLTTCLTKYSIRKCVKVYKYIQKATRSKKHFESSSFLSSATKRVLNKKNSQSYSIYKQQQQRQHCSFQHPKNPSIFTCVVSAKKSGSSEVHPNLRWKAAFSSISSCLRAGTRPLRKSSQRWVVCLVFVKLKHRFLEGDVCWCVIFEVLLLLVIFKVTFWCDLDF